MGLFDWLRGAREEAPAVVVPAAPTEADVLASLDGLKERLTANAAPGIVRARVARVDRLVTRHVETGRETDDATSWVLRSDEANARRVEGGDERADVVLVDGVVTRIRD